MQLYLSEDGGKNWKLYRRSQPDAQKFLFEARRDGTYHFLVRTINQAGQAFPSGPARAELIVMVDTSLPKFDLQTKSGRGGELQIRWNVEEPNFRVGAVELFYQTHPFQRWQKISSKPSRLIGKGRYQGETQAILPQHLSQVQIRAEVRDLAGNVTIINRRVKLTREVVGKKTKEKFASDRSPQKEKPFTQHFLSQQPIIPQRTPPIPSPRKGDFLKHPQQRKQPPVSSRDDLFQRSLERAGVPENKINQPNASDASPQASLKRLPVGEQLQFTNRNSFFLDYEVESLGKDHIADVELWLTDNGGKTWKLHSRDEDRISPLKVQVSQDGVYGFRIVILTKQGLSIARPKPGELAEVWIGVDRQLPQAEILSARYGTAQEAGQLQFRWQVSDLNLAKQPITLQFSEFEQGPWSTIVTGLENSGFYPWKIQGTLPSKIYLRLLARDQAGNIGEHRLAQPIDTTSVIPKVRIRGFRPIQ